MGREDFIKQIENSNEFKVLSRLTNNPEATVEDALQQIVDMAMTAFATIGPPGMKGTVGGGVGLVDYNVSLAVMELAQRLEPVQHGKLVEFVSKLQKQVATDPSTGEPLKIQGDRVWTDLPSFGYTELETWCEFGGDYKDPCDPDMKPEQKQRWVNLNCFLAQLTLVADVQSTYPVDKSLRAIWTMGRALENGEHPLETLVDTAAMQAACSWFIYAADRLWAHVQNGRTYPRASGAGPGTKYSQKAWSGFERERWDVWKQGLQDAKAACVNKEMEKVIGDALIRIEHVMADI